MRFRPGARLLGILVALALWSVVGFFWPLADRLIPIVLALVAAAVVADYFAVRRGIRSLAVARLVASPVGRNQPFTVSLSIANRDQRAWTIDVRDEVPATAQPDFWQERLSVPAQGETTTAASFSIPVRGEFSFGPTWVRVRGLWGLVEAQRVFAGQESVEVYPESLLSPHELAKDAADEVRLLDQLRDTRFRGAGTEFESLEEYRPGDDPKHIDWRTTARFRRPVIRRFQIERHRDVMLLVDCGRLMGADAQRGTKLDCAVDAALRLVRIALRGGDRCGLGIYDDTVAGYLRPLAGSNALPTFLASLYNLQPRWRETDFGPMFAKLQSRLTKRALVIVLSDVIDAETSTRYQKSLATLAQRHVVLFAALQTPLLQSILSAPLESMDGGFRKAVTFRILREREQAIHALRRSGVHVLDVEPAALTAPLINEFIALRGSNLL